TQQFTVDATTDGGQTWRTISQLYSMPIPDPSKPANNGIQVSALRFIDSQHGWAFGPGLLATSDGGKSWVTASVDANVFDLELAQSTLWMLQADSGKCSNCRITVSTSTDRGKTWQAASPLPASWQLIP